MQLQEEIIQTFQGKIFALNKEDPTYEARKEYHQNKMDEELDAVNLSRKIVDEERKNFRI